jgi:hypothetical protein
MALVGMGVGGLVFVAGAFIWCGNVFGFFPTYPMVGYLTMLVGGAIFGWGKKQQGSE